MQCLLRKEISTMEYGQDLDTIEAGITVYII